MAQRSPHNLTTYVSILLILAFAYLFLYLGLYKEIVEPILEKRLPDFMAKAADNSFHPDSRVKNTPYEIEYGDLQQDLENYRAGDIREDPSLNKYNTVIPEANHEKEFRWQYQGQSFSVKLQLSPSLDNAYQNSSLIVYNYDFSSYFNKKTGDIAVKSLAQQLQKIATDNKFNDDQLAELAVSFVQSIPYDGLKAKLMSDKTTSANDPRIKYTTSFQTLYRNKGVCLDKSILGIDLLRALGFGSALLVYDSLPREASDSSIIGHAAFGIQCTDLNKTYKEYPYPYSYIESTGINPIGIVPIWDKDKLISRANNRSAASLGRPRISLRTTGKIYQASQK